jgi:hypothetical protein
MEPKPVFAPSFVNGMIVAVLLVIFKLVLFLMDVDDQSYLQFGNYIIFALGLTWAMYSVRNNRLDGYATYGKAFMIGFYASLGIAVVVAIYTFVFMKYIDPGMINDILSQAEDKMIESNPDMTDDELNKALEITKMIMQPGLMSVISVFISLLTGTIFSVVIAIFAKKESVVIEV